MVNTDTEPRQCDNPDVEHPGFPCNHAASVVECHYCWAILHRRNDNAVWLDANGNDTCPKTTMLEAHRACGAWCNTEDHDGVQDADDFECDGHYDDDFTLTSGVGIGEATYCDGSCMK